MIAEKLGLILLLALIVATLIAAPLAITASLQPRQKTYWRRFGYAFANWGLPGWCILQLLYWLITTRWVPWLP